jgi:hypothetical protein
MFRGPLDQKEKVLEILSALFRVNPFEIIRLVVQRTSQN